MDKKSSQYNEENLAEHAIERGYEIYERWEKNKTPSKNLVSEALDAARAANSATDETAYSMALSYLYALDLRIKKRYKSLLSRIFLIIPYLRERRIFQSLMLMLHLRAGTDLREAITVEIKALREKAQMERENAEDSKDNQGGRTNGRVEDSAKTVKTDEGETVKNENAREDAKEDADREESLEDVVEDTKPQANQQREQKAPSITEQDGISGAKEAVGNDIKDASDGMSHDGGAAGESLNSTKEPAKKSTAAEVTNTTPSVKTEGEERPRGAALDVAIPINPVRNDQTAKVSFIDEVIIDNMAKGVGTASGHDLSHQTQAVQGGGNSAMQNGSSFEKVTEHLYDKAARETAAQEARSTAEQGAKTKNEATAPKPTESRAPEKNEASAPKVDSKGDDKPRVRIHVDMVHVDPENTARREVNDELIDNNLLLVMKSQIETEAREQLELSYAELGIDEPAVIIGHTDMSEAMNEAIKSNSDVLK